MSLLIDQEVACAADGISRRVLLFGGEAAAKPCVNASGESRQPRRLTRGREALPRGHFFLALFFFFYRLISYLYSVLLSLSLLESLPIYSYLIILHACKHM